MTTYTIQYPKEEESRLKQLLSTPALRGTLRVGTVFIKAGSRIPVKGMKANKELEISIIMEGSIKAITHTGEKILRTGNLVVFEPDEMQAGEVLEDCKILWMLLG